MASLSLDTPSPGSPSGIHTPPTPRFGTYLDKWEPHTPRKSARLSSQRAADRTPSPKVSSTRKSQPSNSRSSHNSEESHDDDEAVMTTPTSSPQKKRQPASSSRRVSGSLSAESIRTAATTLGGQLDKMEPHVGRVAATSKLGMLPTPSKTPSRKHSEQKQGQLRAVARNLFISEEEEEEDAVLSTPTNKKRSKRYTGISMDSFAAEENTIEIFTDSHERIPEADSRLENPFYGQGATSAASALEPTRRSARQRKMINVPGEGSQSIEDVVGRDDGTLYVFRGKKVFMKHAKNGPAASPSLKRTTGLNRANQIQPRLLFPSTHHEKTVVHHEDEEAETEIDAPATADEEEPETPAELVEDKAATPKAPRFAPASPPTTARTTRSANKITEEAVPAASSRPAKRSPFASWRVTKKASVGTGQKRSGDLLDAESAAKRPRA